MRKSKSPKTKNLIKVPGNSSASNPFKIEWPQSGGTKLVGAYIPKIHADYLNLLALYKETTASNIVRYAIQEAIKHEISEEEIISTLVSQAIKEWNERLKKNGGEAGWFDRIDIMARFREYQQELRLLLVKRSISDELILRIIKKFEHIYGEI